MGIDVLIERFAGLRVVVVGDVMLDVYLEGEANRLCREAPVPVVEVHRRIQMPGGAGNTAVNLCAPSAEVELISLTGDDGARSELRESLGAAGLSTRRLVADAGRSTPVLRRVSSGSHLLVRFDEGSKGQPSREADAELVRHLKETLPGADAVIVSDYGYGTLSDGVVDALARLRDETQVLVVDSKHPAGFRRLRPTAVKPNWRETLELLGTGELDGLDERAEGIVAHGDRLLELTGARIAAVTLDAEGAVVFERCRPPHRTYANPTQNKQAAGAGDTFVSALTLALAAGSDTPTAAEIASAGAAVAVDKQGTATCSRAELHHRLAAAGKVVAAREALVESVDVMRKRGRRIVFTNGCFDILHRGHITYLNRAKTIGDVLIVGINDDDSVRRLKGPHRPINGVEDRAAVLAALSCVDLIVPFSGDSPTDLLEAVRPDVYVKGGDYTMPTLPEAPVVEALGGTVQILPFMEDRSTTGIIERVRRATAVVGGER